MSRAELEQSILDRVALVADAIKRLNETAKIGMDELHSKPHKKGEKTSECQKSQRI